MPPQTKERTSKGGDAQTLRDYWTGHGHGGPTHHAFEQAIGWGTPGDFSRCVAQVTEHGKMTPEQAKGYCNLRHHEALGYYPAQHAAMEHGKDLGADLYKGFNPNEARSAAGSSTGGQFGSAVGNPTQQRQAQPNNAHQQHLAHVAHENHEAALRQRLNTINAEIANLQKSLAALRAQEANLSKKATAVKKPGPKKTGAGAAVKKPATTTAKKPATKKPSTATQLAAVRSAITTVQGQISSLQAEKSSIQSQLAKIGSVGMNLDGAELYRILIKESGRHNLRHQPTGRFRPRGSDGDELYTALRERRTHDAATLVTGHENRTVVPDLFKYLHKVGPHGYIHGWIKVTADSLLETDTRSPSEARHMISNASSQHLAAAHKDLVANVQRSKVGEHSPHAGQSDALARQIERELAQRSSGEFMNTGAGMATPRTPAEDFAASLNALPPSGTPMGGW